jgi:AmmeMemoRadiSam system protein A
MIEPAVRQRLLQLARAALEASVRRQARPPLPRDLTVDAFGVFVTIHHQGELRGCLGSLDCAHSIVASLVRLAGAVAHEDYRFESLREPELSATTIDVSLLTVPEPMTDHSLLTVGRHGLIVEQGRHRGLLLPQVALEQGWDRDVFLAQTCVKAGLRPDAWRRGATVLQFEAEVFSEQRLGASVE